MSSRVYGPGGEGYGEPHQPPEGGAAGASRPAGPRAPAGRPAPAGPRPPAAPRALRWIGRASVPVRPRRPKADNKRKKERSDPLWAKLFIAFGLVIALVSGGTVFGPRLLGDYFYRGIEAEEDLIPTENVGKDIAGPINILLLGTDLRKKASPSELIISDTIIVAHIPATHDKIYMVSIPRDTWAEIPAQPESGYGGSDPVNKINAAFAYGARTPDRKRDDSPAGWARGAALTIKTIDKLVPGGLPIHGAAIINFDGFKAVLEAIGGVHLCVDTRTQSLHFDKNGVYKGDAYLTANPSQRKTYELGCRDFAPWEALDFARQRKFLADGSGDYGRQRHQQQLLLAIAKKIMSKETMSSPKTILALKDKAGDALQLQLAAAPIDDWVFTLRNLRADDIVMIKSPQGVPETLTIGGLPSAGLWPSKDMKELLKALHDDTVGEFLMAHTQYIGTSGETG